MKKIISIFLALAQSVFGATYYVDFSAGNDTSAGTSQGTAWKTIPGTYKSDNTGFLTVAYGPAGATINTTTKVQAGDIFMLKQGTVHNSANGGKVLINSSYYVTTADTVSSPITLKRDITWGSGSVEFNGTGMTLGGGGFGLIHVVVSGIVVDGVSGTNGIIIAKSPYNGVSAYPIGSDIQGPTIRNVFFGTNGTTYTPGTDDASEGNIHLLRSYGGTIADCVILAGSSSYQGMCFGESHRSCWNYVVTNCTVRDLDGNDDGGIGFKALNSQISWVNCTATGCFKGWDLGEINGDGSNILYRINGATSYSNLFGINMNGAGGTYAGTTEFSIINSVVYTNGDNGIYVYSGPFNIAIVHNTVFGNGMLNGFTDSNLLLHNDPEVPTQLINAYILNNIFYKPWAPHNYYNHYFHQDTISDGLNLNSDYNSWVQRGTEEFAAWAQNNPLPDNTAYAYGANGPGHASGNWWAWYSGTTTPPVNGRTGHFHADAHSVGTGATDTNSPHFYSYPNDIRISEIYSGTNISGRSWYTSDMGIDRAGTNRAATPDMGAMNLDWTQTSLFEKERYPCGAD